MPEATPPKLRRAWFGLAPAAAQRLLSEQRRELQARVEEARAELKAEQARQEELAGEVRGAQARLEALQADLEMLRAALVREQEQAPVAAEVVSRRLAALRQAHETRLQELRFEAIRLEVELERRESQLLAIAAELYRIASSHGQLPAGLAVRMPAQQPGAPAEPAKPKAPEAEAHPESAPSDKT